MERALIKNKLLKRRMGRPAVISLGIALVGASCVLVASSSSATVSSSGPWPNGIAHPAAASCPRGEKAVTATSGQTDAQGVDHFSYKSAPGLVTNLPPAGLRASTVTPKLLADLGVHTSSMTSSSVQQVVRQTVYLSAHRAAPALCEESVQPDFAKVSSASARSGGSAARFTHLFASNWAGYATTEAPSGSTGINYAAGTFAVGQNHTQTQPGAESSWVGIGGGLTANDDTASTVGLIQDGVSMQYDEGYQSWFEFVSDSTTCATTTTCDPQYSTTPGSARPGDSVTAEVWWASSTEACFELTDGQHSAADIPETCVSGTSLPVPYDDTSAEWINEEVVGEGTDGSPSYYITSYDNPGTIKWTQQEISGTLGNAGPFSSPFPGEEAIIMYGTYFPSGATGCGSGNGVLSYPAGAATTSSGGQSSIVTCSVPLYDAP